MAGLAPPLTLPPISGGQQFRAIGYLRWRLFVNAFRRKGGKGEVIAKFFIYPIFLLFIIGPSVGAGFGSWAAVSNNHLDFIPAIFFGIFLLQLFVSINISPPGLSFDPESLIRFPVTFPRYLAVRLFLGILSAANVIGTIALLSAALGISIARPALAGVAFAAVLLLASANVFFLRMIFVWIDRWLSTRRARELFTGLIILSSIAFQYINVTLNPGFHQHDRASQLRKFHTLARLYELSKVILWRLHPGLAGAAIVRFAAGATTSAILDLLAVALFGAAFLAVFAWRMHREYRGENLSDSNITPHHEAFVTEQKNAHPAAHTVAPASSSSLPGTATAAKGPFGLPAALTAAFYKEAIYIRRNTAQLYSLVLPIFMVVIFAGRIGSRGFTFWTFPAAIAYSTLTMAPLAWNSLGLDAGGVQFYFLAPVHLRTILLAKNLFSFGLILVQVAVVLIALTWMGAHPPLWILCATLAWLPFAVFLNLAAGNIRSITAPKKMDPGKLSRKQASQLSALLSVLLVLVVSAIGAGGIFLGLYLGILWLPSLVLLALGIAAFAVYTAGLSRLDTLARNNRENLIEELTKAS